MKIEEAVARRMFVDLGYKIDKWNVKKLTKKLNSLLSMLSEASEVDGDSLDRVKAISQALEDGEEITVIPEEGSVKPSKPKKGSTPSEGSEEATAKPRGRPKGSKSGTKKVKPEKVYALFE